VNYDWGTKSYFKLHLLEQSLNEFNNLFNVSKETMLVSTGRDGRVADLSREWTSNCPQCRGTLTATQAADAW